MSQNDKTEEHTPCFEKDSKQNQTKYENFTNNELLKFKDKNPNNYRKSPLDQNDSLEKQSPSTSRSREKRDNSLSASFYSKNKRSHNRYKKNYSPYKNRSGRYHKYNRSRSRDHSKSFSRNSKRYNNKYNYRKSNKNKYNRSNIDVYIKGKYSHIFRDENYTPITSNNSYLYNNNYLSNNLSNSLDITDTQENEIPISMSDPSKKDIELYVLNLYKDLDEDKVKELLNAALISIEANDSTGGPIINVTKNAEKNYFILEFRTESECQKAMKLNGMKILCRPLKLGKPKYLNENDKKDKNININNANNNMHDLFPMLSSFEKELDYKTQIDSKINNTLFNKDSNNSNLQNYNGNNYQINNNSLNIQDKNNLQTEPGTKLHIMNLPKDLNEDDIYKFFKIFGEIRKIELLKEDGKFNGQCYLEYENEKSNQDALNYGTCVKLGNDFLLIKKINPKDSSQNLISGNNYMKSGNFKQNSTLGILASSVNTVIPFKK